VIDYGNAIACNPAYEQAYYYRGIVYQTCGMHELAIADYLTVLQIGSNDRIKANAHNNLGLAYQAKGKPDKALVEFGKALDLIPDLVNAHYNRALARIDLQDYTRAILDFLRELELYPQSFPSIHYSRALSSFTSREYAKSWKEVEILEAADEKVSRVFLEDLVKASGMRKPLSAGEKKADFHFKTANAHFSDLNFSKAVSEYDLAVEADPLLGKAYFFRGMAHFHLQDYRQCRRDVMKAKSLGYEVSDTLLARLEELIKENEKPEAPAE
ncbi:MAG: tetratricopeptide repeat protein, partial [Candidatus Omnitrophota bacterium]